MTVRPYIFLATQGRASTRTEPGGNPPVANADGPFDVVKDSGIKEFDLSLNDIYIGTPTYTKVSGPAAATVTSDGKLQIDTTGLATGPESGSYSLTATGNSGSDTASFSYDVSAAVAGDVIAGLAASEGNASIDLEPEYPTGITYDSDVDIYAVAAVWSSIGGQGITVPTDFVTVRKHTSGNLHVWIFRKPAAGGESGAVVIPWTAQSAGGGTRLGWAQVFAVRNHTREDATGTDTSGSDGTSADPITAAAQTLSGGTLALLFTVQHIPDDNQAPTIPDFTGESTGDWVRVSHERRIHSNHGAAIACDSASGSASGGTAASDFAGDWVTVAIAAGASTDVGAGEELPAFDEETTPEAHGATGDGSTDDRDALQAMYDYVVANASSGNVIRMTFASGATYRQGSRTELFNASHFHFNGQNATISRHGSWTLSSDQAAGRMIEIRHSSDWGMYDLNWDGRRDIIPNVSSPRKHSVQIQGASNDWEIKRCTSNNTQGDGFQVNKVGDPHGSHSIPDGFLFEDCTADNNLRQGMTIDYGFNGVVRRCTFSNQNGDDPNAGIDFETQSGTGAPAGFVGIDNVLVINCDFFGNDGAHIQCGGNDGLIRNVEIDSCTFRNSTIVNAKRASAIWCRNIAPTPEHNLYIHDNIFEDQMSPAASGEPLGIIYFHNLNDPSILVEDNTFRNNPGAACLVMMRDIGESSNLCTIRGNTMDISTPLTQADSGESNGPAAIAVQWSSVVVENNTITGNEPGSPDQAGVVLESTGSSDPSGATVRNNTFEDLHFGIHIKNGSGFTISGNSFTGCDTNIQDDT